MRGAIKWASLWAIIAAGTLAAPAMATANEVTVIRGDAGDKGRPAAGLPTVLRGWAAGAKRPQPKPEPERKAPQWYATSGETLWFVERGGRRLIGCWTQSSTQVGEIDIRCSRIHRR